MKKQKLTQIIDPKPNVCTLFSTHVQQKKEENLRIETIVRMVTNHFYSAYENSFNTFTAGYNFILFFLVEKYVFHYVINVCHRIISKRLLTVMMIQKT